ncbi:MAG: DoxX family protein [Burkholderiaceae bacterium]
MIDAATAPWAALILRVALGTLFLAHGLLKLLVFKPAGAYGYFKSLGLPGALAYITMTAELAGGTALIIGFMPRYVALLLIPLILGTIVAVHGKNGWIFSNKDGGWEFPAFWALALFVQFLLGDGAWALIASPRWF